MIFLYLFIPLAVILIVSITWTNYKGSPWVPSSMRVVRQMLDLADVQQDELVYDLGCGDGRLVVVAARSYGARGVGIELNPLLWGWCQVLITILGLRERVTIRLGNLFSLDVSDADVVACYLLPATNKKLEEKLIEELRPGTRVVTNTFIFYQTRMAEQDGKARLYIFSPENTQTEFIKRQLIASANED